MLQKKFCTNFDSISHSYSRRRVSTDHGSLSTSDGELTFEPGDIRRLVIVFNLSYYFTTYILHTFYSCYSVLIFNSNLCTGARCM